MDIAIVNSNITQIDADLLVMKHANGFYGTDSIVAETIGFGGLIAKGEAAFVKAKGIGASEVLFIGVGPLKDFRYQEIQKFGMEAIRLARGREPSVRHLALTIHGPGYGLDPEQSFLSMIAGIVAEWKARPTPLVKVSVVEKSAQRCELLDRLLQGQRESFGLLHGTTRLSVVVPENRLIDSSVVDFGARAERKEKLFVAMPFKDEFEDEFEIGFCEAARAGGFACERLDLEHYVGDIVSEIKRRIVGSQGVIALLNGENPNVFLEVGFALAHSKPVILVAKNGVKLPFDVSGQRCIMYKSISHLREALTKFLAALTEQGVLDRPGANSQRAAL